MADTGTQPALPSVGFVSRPQSVKTRSRLQCGWRCGTSMNQHPVSPILLFLELAYFQLWLNLSYTIQ